MDGERGQQRLTAEQRRRLEELEAQREAEYAAELARQRARLQEAEEDGYVTRRVRSQMDAIAEAQRQAEEEELARSGGARDSNPDPLLILGVLLSLVIVGLMLLLPRQ
jgi:hypothetical protein